MFEEKGLVRNGRLAAGVVASFLGLLALPGTAAAVDGFPGQIQGGYGVVKLKNSVTTCTGFMISKRIVVTAGHCVLFETDILSTKEQNESITYTRDGTNYFCISGASTTSSGECSTSSRFKVKAAGVFPFNDKNDFAIVYRTDTDFSNIGDDDALGIRTDAIPVGEDLFMQARGGTRGNENDHRMRIFGPAKVTAVTSSVITIKAEQRGVRPPLQGLPKGVWFCDGDSGGPALFFNDAGVFAEGIGTSYKGGGRCASVGNEEYFFHFRGASIGMINGVIAGQFPVGFPQCVDLANVGLTVPGYYWCNTQP